MLTVLLLDDDPISATHTADDLSAEGLKVIKASPFSALGAIKSAERVDVAILDPGRNVREDVVITGTTPLAVQGQVQVAGEVKANVRSIETPVQVNAAVSMNETVNVNGKVNVGGKVTVDGNVGAKVKPTLLPLP